MGTAAIEHWPGLFALPHGYALGKYRAVLAGAVESLRLADYIASNPH